LLAKIRPVKPPNEKLTRNPTIKNSGVTRYMELLYRLDNQLNSLMPVGTAIIEVELVK
jgi:hypothetical protein